MKWAKLVSTRFSSASMPPISSAHDSASMASSITSSDGVLMVAPSNSAVSSPPFLWSLNILGTGHAGAWLFHPFDGARRQDQHTMAALAAKPLLEAEGDDIELVPRQSPWRSRPRWHHRSSVRPRSSGIQSPSGTLTPEAVPFQGNTTSCSKFTCDRSGSAP